MLPVSKVLFLNHIRQVTAVVTNSHFRPGWWIHPTVFLPSNPVGKEEPALYNKSAFYLPKEFHVSALPKRPAIELLKPLLLYLTTGLLEN